MLVTLSGICIFVILVFPNAYLSIVSRVDGNSKDEIFDLKPNAELDITVTGKSLI